MGSRRSERGATALVVGALAVTLMVLASFTVDFGMAYVSKRQLQTATDAAALAAAASYADLPGNCDTLAKNASAKTAAEGVADKLLLQNRAGSQRVAFIVECSDDLKALDVTVAARASTSVTLGGLMGLSSISTERSATATLDAPDSGLGVRPYMICSTQFPPNQALNTLVTVKFPSPSEPDIPGCPYAGGNWFTLDCPGGGHDLDTTTLKGCDTYVEIVKPQPVEVPPAYPNPNDLRDALLPACEPVEAVDRDCLTADPGGPGSKNVWDAWNTLVGREILLPVFCGTERCDDPATPEKEVGWEGGAATGKGGGSDKGKGGGPTKSPDPGGGSTVGYPVYRLTGVKVCGWHWGPQNSGKYADRPGVDATDPCYAADASAGDSNSNYLQLVYKNVQTSGTSDATNVGLENSNLRRTRLTR